MRICLNIIQQPGELSWEVWRGWFLTTSEHLQAVVPEDSLLELLRSMDSVLLCYLSQIELGFCHLCLKVFWLTLTSTEAEEKTTSATLLPNRAMDDSSTHSETMACLQLEFAVPLAVAAGGLWVRREEAQRGFIGLRDASLGFPPLLPAGMWKPTQCRWHISLIQTEVQATDALGTEGKGDLYISPTATTWMTNFSHWAYWTTSKETCSFQALGTLWYLKVGRSNLVFLDKDCLCIGSHGEKEWAGKSEASLWISQGFRLGITSCVLYLSREHILINLCQHHFPSQWQKPSQANYLHIKGWIRMASVS